MLPILLTAVFALAAIVGIFASVLRCSTCGRWHDSAEADQRCRQRKQGQE